MRGDFKIKSPIDDVFSYKNTVAAGTVASINAGEPTKSAIGPVAIMVDGDGTTTQRFAGMAKSESTETASVAGVVDLYYPVAGLIYVGKAKSAAAADTQAEIDALIAKRVVFDLTATVWTIDTAAVDAATNGVVIVGGDYLTRSIYFTISPTAIVTE